MHSVGEPHPLPPPNLYRTTDMTSLYLSRKEIKPLRLIHTRSMLLSIGIITILINDLPYTLTH